MLKVQNVSREMPDERVKRVADAILGELMHCEPGAFPLEKMARAAIAASDATLEVTWAMREVAARKLEETFDDVCHSDALDIVGDILQAALAAMRGEIK